MSYLKSWIYSRISVNVHFGINDAAYMMQNKPHWPIQIDSILHLVNVVHRSSIQAVLSLNKLFFRESIEIEISAT